jgi:hypothetical protein
LIKEEFELVGLGRIGIGLGSDKRCRRARGRTDNQCLNSWVQVRDITYGALVNTYLNESHRNHPETRFVKIMAQHTAYQNPGLRAAPIAYDNAGTRGAMSVPVEVPIRSQYGFEISLAGSKVIHVPYETQEHQNSYRDDHERIESIVTDGHHGRTLHDV